MFEYPMYAIIGPEASITPYIQWKFDDPDFEHDNLARGVVYHKPGSAPVLWIPCKPRCPHEYAVLAHECVHVAMHMMRWAGIVANYDTEEVLTHATRHLMTEILTHIK